ncbi:MAG: hypothetical protein QOD43_1829 [Gaiellaceae bacterium]|jgi:hypothetical protein|nr:hypothetical protein [Gaiellaceae bacterium]
MRLPRNILTTALPLLLCFSAVSACGSAASAESPSSSARAIAGCPQDPLAGVHDPQRLKVLQPCTTFVGTVTEAPKLNVSDGDVTFNAKPDAGYESMLNDHNVKEGGLHIEIVPRDQAGCTPGQPVKGNAGNLGTCSGANVVFPPLNAHVRVTGAWVLDTWVGQNEMHPVAKVEIIPIAGPPPPEKHLFVAHLVGRSRTAALPRTALASVTLTDLDLCWSFSRLTRVGKPLRATLQGPPVPGGQRRAIPFGTHYAAKGCTTLTEALVQPLLTSPRLYSVVLYTARYKSGAARGQLTPASD